MVALLLRSPHNRSSRLLYTLFSIAAHYVRRTLSNDPTAGLGATLSPNGVGTNRDHLHQLARRDFNKNNTEDIVFACLIPVLVLLSGLFAGLTLGYMSLDETQLHVLSISGTLKQRLYANKIKPIRENGHLLLVTLLLANMIVNETLPVISDPVLGGGVQSVVVSTVLIVIFAEIIPQSVFTRHGLYLGAKMAGPTKVLIYTLGIISWPVAKLLEFVLGSHHGIIYRRAELKELIAMHSSQSHHGGDLKLDTVTIIGATLDLQEKVVKQAMTPIEDVFMLSIDAKLEFKLLKEICQTGHSRVPVYEEVDVVFATPQEKVTRKVKRIVGILLVKNLVLLDPNDAVPIRKLPLNKVPFVPNNESLLGILDRFQEGRSHMAIVSRFSVEKAASVKKVVKKNLTQRLRDRVIGESDTSDEDASAHDDSSQDSNPGSTRLALKKRKTNKRKTKRKDSKGSSTTAAEDEEAEGGSTVAEADTRSRRSSPDVLKKDFAKNHNDEGEGPFARIRRAGRKAKPVDPEMGLASSEQEPEQAEPQAGETEKRVTPASQIATKFLSREQSMPADAVLAKEGANEFLQGFDPAVMPLGIITLEDVLEELIGEEIYDEFDPQGAHGDPVQPPPEPHAESEAAPPPFSVSPLPPHSAQAATNLGTSGGGASYKPIQIPLPMSLRNLNLFARSRSAPPMDEKEREDAEEDRKKEEPAVVKDDTTIATPNVNTPQQTAQNTAPILRMPRPLRGFHEKPPLPPSVAVTGMAAASAPTPAVPSAVSGTTVAQIDTGKGSSRPSSPAPPLEAILLERKRRMVAANVTAAGGSPAMSRSTTSASTAGHSTGGNFSSGGGTGGLGKGSRFKSSPLSPTPGPKSGAEKVKMTASASDRSGAGAEEVASTSANVGVVGASIPEGEGDGEPRTFNETLTDSG